MKYLKWAAYAVIALVALAYFFDLKGSEQTNALIFFTAWGFIWLVQEVKNVVQMHFFRVQRSQERILEELATLKNELFLLRQDK